MRQEQPTTRDIEELLSFLPTLSEESFDPIRQWHGIEEQEEGYFTLPYADYDPLVDELSAVASRECWRDHDYDPIEISGRLPQPDFIDKADLARVKSILTYFVRGERFCDGHQGGMIREGYIQRLLIRLSDLHREAI